MTYQTIRSETRGRVTLITLDRPQALNALTVEMEAELIHAFGAFDADPSQGCAVVTGNAKAFAAGGDIKDMQAKGFAEMFSENFFMGFDRVAATRKPWLAAVAGYALGGGCELAMMADFILAADTARFGQPEIRLAVAPGMGGTQRLARALGKAKAMELCLTGRTMDAEEAERAGLVSRIVPADRLIEEAMETAALIAAMPSLATLAVKEMVNAAFETQLTQGIAFERRLFHALFATADKEEGMAAFVEKRPAVWAGR